MNADNASVKDGGKSVPKHDDENNAGNRRGLLAVGIALAVVAASMAGIYAGRDAIWHHGKDIVAGAFGEYNKTHMSIPANSVGRTAGFYEFNTSGTTVRFFAVKDGNGTIHTAFDASPTDAGRPYGFRQVGNMMVHNNTNTSFPIEAITEAGCSGTGCHPAYLPSHVEGGRLMIAKASLMKGAPLFRTGVDIAEVENFNLTTIAIPLSSVSAAARWFEYDISGATVRFFAVADSSGQVRTAFDECPMCYEAHLGFRQDGNMMVENCCDMPFAIDSIGPDNTGCHPEYLQSRVEGDRVMMARSSLLAGAYLFREADASAGVENLNLTTVAIPLQMVTANASWYVYGISGATVRFFAVKDANGAVHASLDECPKCYKKHAGFRQEGDTMVENCCNMPFPIVNITAEGCNLTGCHPQYLPCTVDGDRVLFTKSNLAAGAYLFKPLNESAGVEDLDALTVAIPLSAVSMTARWYEYGINGTTVRFFAVKDTNGTVHLSMDACPKCYKKHAGFRQEGGSMVENCCNMPYPFENITAEGCNRTGCHPAFLPDHIEGDRVMILKSDLVAGSYMFQSGRR